VAFVLARVDLKNAKPDQAIYLWATANPNAPPEESIVIEGSTAGVQAGLEVRMSVLAVATPFPECGTWNWCPPYSG